MSMSIMFTLALGLNLGPLYGAKAARLKVLRTKT